MLYAGCIPGTGCEWYSAYPSSETGSNHNPCDTDEWTEITLEKSAARTLVLATRPGCGFPDADLDYKLYLVTDSWQVVDSGSFEARHRARCKVDASMHLDCTL